MTIYTETLAISKVTEKQKKHVKRRAKREGVAQVDIIRDLIDKDMEDKKRG